MRKLYLATALALGPLLLETPSFLGLAATTTAQVVGPLPTFRPFFARSYGGKCLDFGGQAWWAVGAPVFIYTCNGTVAQQIDGEEIEPGLTSQHTVILHAGKGHWFEGQCTACSGSVRIAGLQGLGGAGF